MAIMLIPGRQSLYLPHYLPLTLYFTLSPSLSPSLSPPSISPCRNSNLMHFNNKVVAIYIDTFGNHCQFITCLFTLFLVSVSTTT